MLKARATIYLPKPATEPARVPPEPGETIAVAGSDALVHRPGLSVIAPGERFDPDVWGVDAAEADRLVRTGAADP